MNGEQPDRVGLPDPPCFQAKLLLLRRRQVREERAERGLRLIAGEGRGNVSELVQVRPCRAGVSAGPGRDLDVQAERPLDFGDEVGDRPADVPAQPPGLRGE